MPIRVVDLLKIIQINKGDRQFLVVALRVSDCQFQPVFQEQAIGQPSQ